MTEKNIDTARESYRPVAFRTAVLFFCIVELTNIDPMYQKLRCNRAILQMSLASYAANLLHLLERYSLQWFQKLFTIAIDTSPKSEDFEERRLALT